MKLKSLIILILLTAFGITIDAQHVNLSEPIIAETNVFEDRDGVVAVEAKYFYKQSKTDKRQWYRVSTQQAPKVVPDKDGNNSLEANNSEYVEIAGMVFNSSIENSKLPTINPPAGRIAIVADGNSPDPDDLGATAVSLALLRAAGLEDRLVHYSHSCDLERVERISARAENERHALMQSACDVTARRWGGFDALTFYDAKWHQDETVKDLTKAINSSSAEDPLWIIEAGEPDIIGYALDASQKSKHQYVKVITHHPANDDAGDFYSWQQILDYGVEEVRIPDQNTNLKVAIEKWDWARVHPDARLQQVWLQGKIAEVDNVVKFQKGKWDCSDAGMVLYWITGATNGGLSMGEVEDVKSLLLDFVAKNPE